MYRNYLDTLPSSILLLSSGLATYKLGSITFGIGFISVPSSCSIRCKLKRSSYVIRLIAIPKWPNRPDRPIRCKYVSAIFGKSKLITTFTACTSIPRVNKSLLTCTYINHAFYTCTFTSNSRKIVEMIQKQRNKETTFFFIRFILTKFLHKPARKSWNTRFRWACAIFACM